MKKIIAIVAAVLMLCSIIPMAALSVSAASIFSANFDNGEVVFSVNADDTAVIEDGVLHWTTGGWKNLYKSFNGVAGTEYVLSVKAKASKAVDLKFVFHNGSWSGYVAPDFVPTLSTEWATYTYHFTPTEKGIVLLLQAKGAAEIWLDDIKVSEYVAPVDPVFPEDAIYTETFENGSLNGWNYNCSVVSTEDLAATNAEGGNYCLEFISPSYSYTNYKLNNLEKNTDYKVTFSVLSATSGYPLNGRVRDGSGDLGYAQYTPSTTAWETHTYLFNSGNNTSANLRFQAGWETGTYYIDNISVTPIDLSTVANDGHVMNGNFETGDSLGWNASANTTIVADPTGAGQGYVIKTSETGSSVDMFTQEFKNLVAGKTYTISLKVYGYGTATNNVFFIRVPKDVTFSNPTGIATSDSGKTYVARFNMNANTGKWITVTLDFVAASSTALVQIQNYRSGQGFYYFDDIALSHAYDAVVTNPDCENGGYTTYTCACGATYKDNYTNAKGHTPGAAADCVNAQTCTICGAELAAALGHDWADATCTAPKTCSVCGATEGDALGHDWADATCTAPKTCSVCGATEGEALGHTYDNDCDADCNVCGTAREVADHVYADAFDTTCDICGAVRAVVAPSTTHGFSASEDVRGLAVRFEVPVTGMGIDMTTAIYDNAYVNGYKLISMGAIASNGVSEKDIPVVYLCDDDVSSSAKFAIRIINIPEGKEDVEITFTPYIIVEIDGEQVTIYGEAKSNTYGAFFG